MIEFVQQKIDKLCVFVEKTGKIIRFVYWMPYLAPLLAASWVRRFIRRKYKIMKTWEISFPCVRICANEASHCKSKRKGKRKYV